MPRVEFVNLSLNHLTGPIQKPPVTKMDHLRNLVLNNTKLEWCSVEKLLRLLPALEELHLSLNEYTHVLIDTVNPTERSNSERGSTEGSSQGTATDASSNNNTHDGSATSQTKERKEVEEETPYASCSCSTSSTESQQQQTDAEEPPPLQTDPHGGVRKLHLTGNYISEWGEICRIGRVFPQLEALVLADCPLRYVE